MGALREWLDAADRDLTSASVALTDEWVWVGDAGDDAIYFLPLPEPDPSLLGLCAVGSLLALRRMRRPAPHGRSDTECRKFKPRNRYVR